MWESFPSGHPAGAVAIARAVGRSYPHLESRLVAAAVLAGIIKIFKGDHYPSDVLAGLALGLVAERAFA